MGTLSAILNACDRREHQSRRRLSVPATAAAGGTRRQPAFGQIGGYTVTQRRDRSSNGRLEHDVRAVHAIARQHRSTPINPATSAMPRGSELIASRQIGEGDERREQRPSSNWR